MSNRIGFEKKSSLLALSSLVRSCGFLMLLMASPLWSQSSKEETPIKGAFMAAVDDTATIFVNGKEIAKLAGVNKSPELDLKIGDRVVVHLWQNWGPRFFMMVFQSSDSKTLVSFRAKDFRNVPDVGVQDFTLEQFKAWKKSPKHEKPEDTDLKKLPVKSNSDWMWGPLDDCFIACIVTEDMIKRR